MAKRTSRHPASSGNASAIQSAKNQPAVRLLKKWMTDESGYDEKVWPVVKKSIERNRLSARKRFDG